MRAEMVAALPADHPVGAAATIELWTALPQTEKQPVAGIESQLRRSRVEREMLGQFAARVRGLTAKREISSGSAGESGSMAAAGRASARVPAESIPLRAARRVRESCNGFLS